MIRRLVAVLIVPFVMIIIMLSMFTVAVPFIRNEQGLAADTASWLLIAYTLPHMMFMPLYGRLGDGIGKRRLLLLGVGLFVVGTALLAVVHDFPAILIARAIQGTGASSVNPIALAMIVERSAPAQRGKAVGAWNSSGPIAGFLGPLMGGPLIDAFGWRSILVPALAVAVTAFVVIWLRLPRSERTVSARTLFRSFDWTGVMLFNAAVALLVLFTSSRPITGAAPLTDLRLLVPGLLLLGVFVRRSLRRDDPFIDLSIFRGRNFTIASLVVSLRMVLRGGVAFLMPLYVTDLYGFSAAGTGALLMLDTGALLVTMWLGGIVVDLRKSRSQVVIGLVVEVLVLLVLVALPPGASPVWVFVVVAVNALGAGYSLAALHVYAMGGVSSEKSATAAGLYSMIRFTGSMLGPAIGGIVLASGLERLGTSFAGYRPAFWFMALVAAAASLLALLLTRRIPASER
ncbi:MAG: MFS transporter [Spirochaetota bacterium]